MMRIMNLRSMSLASILLIPSIGSASILGFQTLELDFKNPKKVKTLASWSKPDKIGLNESGLGFDGNGPGENLDLSIETTRPYGIGYSWRPAQSASISVRIDPPYREVTLSNGQKWNPWSGNFFVRYSPDTKHWSSWQMLPSAAPAAGKGAIQFKGQIGVPQKERTAYQDYQYAYFKEDVPWTSDEEAMVRWMTKKEPDFFARHLPFMGYLQFLYETELPARQRIGNIKIEVSYGLSGLATIPKDKKIQQDRDIPWRFTGK